MKKKYLYIILLICILALVVGGYLLFKNSNTMQSDEKNENNIENEQENSNLNNAAIIKDNVVTIKNGIIKNENLIDDFINADSYQNNRLEIIQDNDKITVESVKPEASETSENLNNDGVVNITENAGDGSAESNKKLYGYYILTVNGKQDGEYDKSNFLIKRSVSNNEVTLYFDAPYMDLIKIPIICKYSLESSNYKKIFDLKYSQRKDLGIYEIYDAGDFKVKTFGGNVSVTIYNNVDENNNTNNGNAFVNETNDSNTIANNTYKLQTALENNFLSCDDIIEQAKMDAKYGICSSSSYNDGGSTEYCYYGEQNNQYTILKLNTEDGNKDLVIGFAGPILNEYSKYRFD